MSSSHSLEARVKQLSRMGVEPDWRVFQRILAHGAAARPALLQLATKTDDLFTALPTALGPIHALRLLGEIPDVSMIDPLLNALVDINDALFELGERTDHPLILYALDLPNMVGRIGAPAIAPLWAYYDDPTEDLLIQITAMESMGHVATFDPTQREAIIQEAHRRMTDPTTNVEHVTTFVRLLADLHDAPSYKLIMDLFRTKRVNSRAFPAAEARQRLLGNKSNILNCVKHSLEERYDQHSLRNVKPYDDVDDDDDEWED